MQFIERFKPTFAKAADRAGAFAARNPVLPVMMFGVVALGALEANAANHPQEKPVERAQPFMAQKCDMDPNDWAEQLVRKYAPEWRERPCDPNKSVFALLLE